MTDLGQEVVDRIFNGLQVDDRWSVRSEGRFTWWAHEHAQTVRAEAVEPDLFRVTVETDLVQTGSATMDHHLAASLLGGFATLSASVLVDEKLVTRCSALVNPDNVSWTSPILQFAAVIQTASAERNATRWAEIFHGESAITNHPASGPREDPDEMLEALDHIPDAAGWEDEAEFEGAVDMLTGFGLLATGGGLGLTVEFPFGPNGGSAIEGGDSNLLQVTAEHVHPVLGPGLTMLLQLAEWPRREAGGTLAPSELNALEETEGCRAHLIGSWTIADDAAVSKRPPHFRCFVPAVLHQASVLPNLALSMGARSKWVSEEMAQAE
jgi:hypothetical protein